MVLAEKVRGGNARAAARFISNIENKVPAAREALTSIYCHTGKAHILGVSGPPGTGKSTLEDKFGQTFWEQGNTMGVVAVVPSRGSKIKE